MLVQREKCRNGPLSKRESKSVLFGEKDWVGVSKCVFAIVLKVASSETLHRAASDKCSYFVLGGVLAGTILALTPSWSSCLSRLFLDEHIGCCVG